MLYIVIMKDKIIPKLLHIRESQFNRLEWDYLNNGVRYSETVRRALDEYWEKRDAEKE